MAETGPSPRPAAGPRRSFRQRFQLHLPSLALGLLLGVGTSVAVFGAWHRSRPPLAEGKKSPPASASGRSSLPLPPAESDAESTPAAKSSENGSRNAQIDALLNSADVAFRAKMDGCPAVSLAIRLAQEPDDRLLQGKVPPAQRQEIRSYAQRCGLRF